MGDLKIHITKYMNGSSRLLVSALNLTSECLRPFLSFLEFVRPCRDYSNEIPPKSLRGLTLRKSKFLMYTLVYILIWKVINFF